MPKLNTLAANCQKLTHTKIKALFLAKIMPTQSIPIYSSKMLQYKTISLCKEAINAN